MEHTERFLARLEAALAPAGTCSEGMVMQSGIHGILGGRISAGVAGNRDTSPGRSVSNSAPVTVSTAAFGPTASTSASSGLRHLLPHNATGAAFWAGVLGLGALAWIRHSLPA